MSCESETNEFWLKFCVIVVGAIIIFTIVLSIYKGYKKDILLKMVEAGASPVEAQISLHEIHSTDHAFYLQAMQCSQKISAK